MKIVLTFAAFDGWKPVVLTCGLLGTLELLTANVLEPLLYGSSVGLSPFAVVFAAVFWTWLWGVAGLLLAMPLTVCLVVLGRYVPELEFLPILLSDEPALASEIRLYQRLLAVDAVEAGAILRSQSHNCDALSDELVLPVLRRLAEEGRPGPGGDASSRMRELLAELLDGVATEGDGGQPRGLRVLWLPAKDETDALAARWLARTLESSGVQSIVASAQALATENVERINAEAPDVVCISALSADSKALARHLCKRLARDQGSREILIGFWAASTVAPDRSEARITRFTQASELRTKLSGLAARLRVYPYDGCAPVRNADTATVQAS